MDTIQVLAINGDANWTLDLSRVPNVGEMVRIEDRIYVVNSVLHTPHTAGYSAEIRVSLDRRHR